MKAARNGHIDIVELLIRYHADVNSKDKVLMETMLMAEVNKNIIAILIIA